MEVVVGLAAAAALGVVGIVWWTYVHRAVADRPTRHDPESGSYARPPVQAVEPTEWEDSYSGLANSDVLVGPPIVLGDGESLRSGMGDPVTLRDWLVHLHPDSNNVWADVVSEFYAAAASDPAIADYFDGVDMAALQRHFLSALMILTGSGLTVGTYRRMQVKHADVRNIMGEGITSGTYDAAVGVLVEILRRKKVPSATLRQVGFLLASLRGAIVVHAEPRT